MQALFAWSSVALGGGSVMFVSLLLFRRIRLYRIEVERDQAEERLEPLALALVSGEETEAVDTRDAGVLAGLLSRYARQVTGDSRSALADYFEASGSVDRAMAALGDRHAWRRAAAADLLGAMGSEQAIGALRDALGDGSRDVRTAAARSLGRLRASAAVEDLVRVFVTADVAHGVAGEALLGLGSAALPALRALTHHGDPGLREAAVELLGLLGEPADSPLLVARLRDSAAEVRASAARALGRLAAEDAAAAVRGALDDRIPFVRAAAARALGEIGGRDAAPALLALARSDHYDAAQSAARALARVDPELLAAAGREEFGQHVLEAADRAAIRS
ncbi:MAG TPA: HEAT repeat domain-containing protein [Gaiellaceae bacterium]|nr:HEAT repeat domain-containing protein [Gaiellaceae bacterium]